MTHVVQNDGFETPGTVTGEADQWVVNFLAALEEFADYDRNQSQSPPDSVGAENFSEGWVAEGATAARPQPGPATVDQVFLPKFSVDIPPELELAIYGPSTAPDTFDGFEKEWQVTDPARILLLWPPPDAVQPGQQYIAVPGFDFADYDTSTVLVRDPESFETGWGTVLTSFAPTDLEFALYTALVPEGQDSFEVGWGADALQDWSGLVTAGDADSTTYGDGGPIGDFTTIFSDQENFGDSDTYPTSIISPQSIVSVDLGTDVITLLAAGPLGPDGAADFIKFEETSGPLGDAKLPVPLVATAPYICVLLAGGLSITVHAQLGAAKENLTSVGLGANVVHFNWNKYWSREMTTV